MTNNNENENAQIVEEEGQMVAEISLEDELLRSIEFDHKRNDKYDEDFITEFDETAIDGLIKKCKMAYMDDDDGYKLNAHRKVLTWLKGKIAQNAIKVQNETIKAEIEDWNNKYENMNRDDGYKHIIAGAVKNKPKTQKEYKQAYEDLVAALEANGSKEEVVECPHKLIETETEKSVKEFKVKMAKKCAGSKPGIGEDCYNPNTRDGMKRWIGEGNKGWKCNDCCKCYNTERRMISHQKDRPNKKNTSQTIISACKNAGFTIITKIEEI